ncbi:MAG: hypothetical protein JWP97_2019 [Labilithrix sp.]|nr:hypothetical protein [Labilithrix sp.]
MTEARRLRLTIAGIDSVLGSDECAACTYSPAGCCVAPPRYDWSDLARVVKHGGAEWLAGELAAGRLVRIDHGLSLRRDKGRVTADRGSPRIAKCTFHDGRSGCTIDSSRRPATCNIYLCDRALAAGDHPSATRAREVHDALVADFVRWDAALDARVREAWPDPGARYSPEFFTWLADAFDDAARAG